MTTVNIKLLALQKKHAAEKRLGALQDEMDAVKQQIAEWEEYIAKTDALLSDSPSNVSPRVPENGRAESQEPSANGRAVRVQKKTWAGMSARLLLDRGPLLLAELADALLQSGKGKDVNTFPTVLNSALWRRKDLFEKKEDRRYHLRTKEIAFTD
jgi:hypothetical protein